MMLSSAECERLVSLFNAGDFSVLEKEAEQLTQRFPDSGFAWKALGTALQMQKKPALQVLQRAAQLLPDDAEAHSNLGNALRREQRLDEAVVCFQRALSINPHNDAALCNLGIVLREQGNYSEALARFRQALEINPGSSVIHYNLANLFRVTGAHEQAVASYRTALAINPGLLEARSNLLFSLNLIPGVSAEIRFQEALDFGALFGNLPQAASWDNQIDSEKPLRVGLVSGDLRNHAVSYFLLGTLHELSRTASGRLSIYAYSNNRYEDGISEQLQVYCQVWRCVATLSDQELAEQIRADGIDILVDLSGHTAHNRLPLFAMKPTPVQISWLGYFATTGLKAMDYLLADPWALPASEEQWFVERIWRLPETRLCFTPPGIAIDITPLPACSNGFVTFGCFNNLSKVNAEVVAVWSKILAELPDSRLLLKSEQLNDRWIREQTLQCFGKHDICSGRLILEGHEPMSGYLAAYQRVDIGLDPFPYPGGTTTVESLWMGVPVLTLAGGSFAARQGAGLLMNAGLPEWVSVDVADYVARAISHARDLGRLATLRANLRQQLLLSPLCDAPRFAQHFEQALRGIWRHWCTEQQPALTVNQTVQQAPGPNEITALVALFTEGKYAEASSLALELTVRFPLHGFGWKMLGATLRQLRRSEEALESLQKATALIPRDAEAHTILGITLKDLGQLEKAMISYNCALEVAPDYAEAHYNLGITLKALRRLTEAEASYQRALQLKSDYVEAHINLGLLFLEQDRSSEAFLHFQKALDIAPSRLDAQEGMSMTLKRMVPEWHVPMMNEQKRNTAYYSALKSVITPESEVFEIGTGSGLLALMAAKLGAGKVTTCETVPLIAETAQQIITDNGYENVITVVPKQSTRVALGEDLPNQADLLVSEIFSSELLGEGVIQSIEDAKRRLLRPRGRVIPAAGSIMIALFGGNDVKANLLVEDSFGFKLRRFNTIVSKKRLIARNDLTIEMLTDEMEAFRFDFENDSFFPSQTKKLHIPIKYPGQCCGIIQWIQLQMDKETVFSNHPQEKSVVANWQHCAYIFNEPVDVTPGQIVVVSASHNRTIPWFCLDSIEPD